MVGSTPWLSQTASKSIRRYNEEALCSRMLRSRYVREKQAQAQTLIPAQGVVYSTFDADRPRYVVKILDLDTEERAIYQLLLGDPDPANHTVPGELTQLGYPLLIMPHLSSYHYLCPQEFSLSETLAMFAQLIEVGLAVPRLYVNLAHIPRPAGCRVSASPEHRSHGSSLAPREYSKPPSYVVLCFARIYATATSSPLHDTTRKTTRTSCRTGYTSLTSTRRGGSRTAQVLNAR